MNWGIFSKYFINKLETNIQKNWDPVQKDNTQIYKLPMHKSRAWKWQNGFLSTLHIEKRLPEKLCSNTPLMLKWELIFHLWECPSWYVVNISRDPLLTFEKYMLCIANSLSSIFKVILKYSTKYFVRSWYLVDRLYYLRYIYCFCTYVLWLFPYC